MNRLILRISVMLSFLVSPAASQTVIIDPGHGYCKHPHHSTRNFNCDQRTDLEIKTNLVVALKLKRIIQDSTNWNVYLTRETDDGWMSLIQRVSFASNSNYDADVFLSIHCNAGGGSGTESFWCNENSSRAANNEKFAKEIDRMLLNLCSCKSRRVVDDYTYLRNTNNQFIHLSVLRTNPTVACLNELGFVDDPDDRQKLESESMREKFALAYYLALKEIIQSL